MSGERFFELADQVTIGALASGMHGNDDIITNTEYSGRVFGLNEITDNFVIKKVNLGPLYTLLFVFLLYFWII